METIIAQGLAQMGLSPDAAPRLAEYGRLLLEQNQVMNLTAITQPDKVARLHMLDCAALANAVELKGKTLLDVGTGAGFPGLPLRLVEPTLRVTLLDSLGKRVNWLAGLCPRLGAPDVVCVHARAEEQALLPGWRDSFDLVTSRAVADLSVLCELCLPFVRVGGLFLAMKAADCQEEVDRAGRAVSLLGGRLLPAWDYAIPGADVTRRLVRIEKVSPTPKGYPRRFAKIQKAPL